MPTFDDKYIIDDVSCIRMTERAILVRIPAIAREPQWVPQSQIDDDSEVWQPGDSGTLIVSQWLADEKGWTGSRRVAASQAQPAPRQLDLPRPQPRPLEARPPQPTRVKTVDVCPTCKRPL